MTHNYFEKDKIFSLKPQKSTMNFFGASVRHFFLNFARAPKNAFLAHAVRQKKTLFWNEPNVFAHRGRTPGGMCQVEAVILIKCLPQHETF